MYRPIPELHPQKVDLISAKKRTAAILGMTYFAPVTIATRICRLNRSRSGEILDVALPMASTRRESWKDLASSMPCIRGFLRPWSRACLKETLFASKSFRSGAELWSLHANLTETPILHSKLQRLESVLSFGLDAKADHLNLYPYRLIHRDARALG